MPAAPPASRRGRPPKRTSEQEAVEAPVAVRPKAKAKARARSASVAETVFYPDEQPQRAVSVPAPKRRGRPPKQPVTLPTQEEALRNEAAALRQARRDRVKANITKFIRHAEAKAAAKKDRPVPTEEEEEAHVDKKPRVRKVAIEKSPASRSASLAVEKRPRGRPKGSLGKKKRDALLQEELRRLENADV